MSDFRHLHHPNCFQRIGVVPDGLPDNLCDCRTLLTIEVAELRATLAAVSALAKEAISGIGGSHSHWREGGAGGVCRTCARETERRGDLRERLDTVLARSDHAAAEGKGGES